MRREHWVDDSRLPEWAGGLMMLTLVGAASRSGESTPAEHPVVAVPALLVNLCDYGGSASAKFIVPSGFAPVEQLPRLGGLVLCGLPATRDGKAVSYAGVVDGTLIDHKAPHGMMAGGEGDRIITTVSLVFPDAGAAQDLHWALTEAHAKNIYRQVDVSFPDRKEVRDMYGKVVSVVYGPKRISVTPIDGLMESLDRSPAFRRLVDSSRRSMSVEKYAETFFAGSNADAVKLFSAAINQFGGDVLLERMREMLLASQAEEVLAKERERQDAFARSTARKRMIITPVNPAPVKPVPRVSIEGIRGLAQRAVKRDGKGGHPVEAELDALVMALTSSGYHYLPLAVRHGNGDVRNTWLHRLAQAKTWDEVNGEEVLASSKNYPWNKPPPSVGQASGVIFDYVEAPLLPLIDSGPGLLADEDGYIGPDDIFEADPPPWLDDDADEVMF
jgi:hypothetical protein